MKLACLVDWIGHYILLSILCNDQLVNLLGFLKVGFQNLGFFDINSMLKLIVWFLKYNWTFLTALEHASCVDIVHASYRLLCFFFSNCVWCSLPLGFSFVFALCLFSVYPFCSLALWLGRLEPIRHPFLLLLHLLIVRGSLVRKTKKLLRSWTFVRMYGLRGK